jgi:hypothetical protein
MDKVCGDAGDGDAGIGKWGVARNLDTGKRGTSAVLSAPLGDCKPVGASKCGWCCADFFGSGKCKGYAYPVTAAVSLIRE